MEIAMDIPDNLAVHLRDREDQLSQIIEIGLRKIDANTHSTFDDALEILEKLVAFPSAKEIIDLRPSDGLQKRMDALQKKSH